MYLAWVGLHCHSMWKYIALSGLTRVRQDTSPRNASYPDPALPLKGGARDTKISTALEKIK